MKIGILGAGFMGRMHAEIYRSIPGVEVAEIVGRTLEKTKSAGEQLGVDWSLDPESLLLREDIDVIDVCSPTKFHTQAVMDALSAGKHVFCETPVSYQEREVDAMAIAARESGKLMMVALFDRFQGPYQKIHQLVTEGVLGRVKMVFANRRTSSYWGLPVEDPITMEPVINLMIHDFDVLRWFLGRPKSIIAHGQKGPSGTEEHLIAAIEYEHCLTWVEGTAIMPGSFPFSTSLRVVGEEGAVDLNWAMGSRGPNYELWLYPKDGEPQKLEADGINPYEAECRYVVSCIRGEADPELLGIETARDSLRVALAAKTSLEKGGERVSLAWE